MTTPVLQILIASTRPGRVGPSVAAWIHERALAHGGFTVELIDLAEVNLPMFDEPKHPRLREYTHQHTKDWSATISRAGAFIFVIPEYNYGFNAAIKNAIDYLNHEWKYKPVGLVSYGGVGAGTRAAQTPKPVLTTLRSVPLVEAVSLPAALQFLEAGPTLPPSELREPAAPGLLAAAGRTSGGLRAARAPADGRHAAAAGRTQRPSGR